MLHGARSTDVESNEGAAQAVTVTDGRDLSTRRDTDYFAVLSSYD
jgi:hypothetical protein